MPAETLADDVEPARQRGIAEVRCGSRGKGDRIVATSDFSGLVSSTCALASAAAMVAMVSLERCIAASLQVQKIDCHGAGFEASGPNPMPDCLFGVLRH